MKHSRRDFLKNAAAGALLGLTTVSGKNNRLFGQNLTTEKSGAYPLCETVEKFRARQKKAGKLLRPTGLDRKEYLRLIGGIVGFFAPLQDARGAIIDPYEKRERQYSTPAFAAAAGCLIAHGGTEFQKLLPKAIMAMNCATEDLMLGKTADNHSSFYTILLMQALDFLEKIAPAADAAIWRENLSKVVPEKIYRHKITAQSNWNIVAASGEWRRKKRGLAANLDWMNAVLDTQMNFFTAHGLYRDPHEPLAYDHFARYHALDLLAEGYDGKHRENLSELVKRGAWTSLFMQSPHGELPTGGRSAHHQWNEAEQAMTFETFAAVYARRGDREAAGAFKRAARLALRSIGKWQRDSGELFILKNRFDPAQRFGYETYSYHSQYNLLAAAMLAAAYVRADETIAELPCPAEIGGFTFAVQPEFHKVFANSGGMYLEIDTRADAGYNPTGLIRVAHPQINPQLTVSDGATAKNSYQLPTKPTRFIAFGAGWKDKQGNWHALAAENEKTLRDAKVKIIREDAEKVEFSVEYAGDFPGGVNSVVQFYTVTPRRIEVVETVTGDIAAMRIYFPLLLTDGKNQTKINIEENQISAANESGERVIYRVYGKNVRVGRLNVSEPFRSGMLDAAYAETAEKTVRYIIEPRPSPKK